MGHFDRWCTLLLVLTSKWIHTVDSFPEHTGRWMNLFGWDRPSLRCNIERHTLKGRRWMLMGRESRKAVPLPWLWGMRRTLGSIFLGFRSSWGHRCSIWLRNRDIGQHCSERKNLWWGLIVLKMWTTHNYEAKRDWWTRTVLDVRWRACIELLAAMCYSSKAF